MTAGTMHPRLQLGLRKEEAELGQWEKKTKRLQADLAKAVQARESREAANTYEKSWRKSWVYSRLYVQCCCVYLGFPEHFM